MPVLTTQERRRPRTTLRVIHTHRTGSKVSQRISELVFVRGRPVALLDWINLAGVRTPLYVCDLDAAKLKRAEGRTYRYEGVTADPRFEETG